MNKANEPAKTTNRLRLIQIVIIPRRKKREGKWVESFLGAGGTLKLD